MGKRMGIHANRLLSFHAVKVFFRLKSSPGLCQFGRKNNEPLNIDSRRLRRTVKPDLAHMEKRIVGFHQDDERHWVAELECGHNQHVRHNPPWTNRPWVITPQGRAKALGRTVKCKKCDTGAPSDRS